MPAAAVAENSGHADNHRGEQDDKTENDDHDALRIEAAGRPRERRHRASSSFISESTLPEACGKLPIREGFITATDHL
jgi:hypothetical protein